MFALIGAVLVILAAFGVVIGSVNLLYLGIGIFFLHFAFGPLVSWPALHRE